jgi:hypothetical protein
MKAMSTLDDLCTIASKHMKKCPFCNGHSTTIRFMDSINIAPNCKCGVVGKKLPLPELAYDNWEEDLVQKALAFWNNRPNNESLTEE